MTPYYDRTDKELIALLKERDQEAFTEMFLAVFFGVFKKLTKFSNILRYS
ncbi:hypothetical protein SAMN06265350_101115 [Solitalea koreensis]|uniref:Uncharacterized protein n=1 Tax=Solitalea koreensis TaxID=543615 RepID=A0A521AG12_9SPHI|nr:hypothetical protein SAMN06265350_101115 [Solitalea koreensis]